MLVIGKHVVESGLKNTLEELLKSFSVVTEIGIAPEAPLCEVDRLIQTGRKENIDAVISVGGGSVLDAANAAATIIPKEGLTKDYFYGEREISEKGLFFVAIPTTSGTGTEITKNAVLYDPETKIKKSIRHPLMIPDAAIVDPELTVSASPKLTAASGLDAFTQAVESYTGAKANAVTKSLAKTAVVKIYNSLERAFGEPGNLEARSEMAEGSLLTALAFSHSGLGAVHGLAHPIGSLLKVPHGEACAILLVPILHWNLPVVEKEYNELAEACGLNSAKEFVEAVAALREKLSIPANFANYGLKEEHFPFIVKNCRSGSMQSNPRPMTDEEILNLMKELT